MKEGYYKIEKKIIRHEAVAGIPEQSHLELVKEYPNGGKDYRTVIDVEAVPPREAYDEEIEEKIWVDYTENELALIRIEELKQKLRDTDYKAIKYAEGYYTEEEYALMKQERQGWRDEINQLEEMLSTDTK